MFNSTNTFVAGTGYVNTLNDNDVLTGLGDDAELNVQIGASNDIDVDASIQPTLVNIKTVNVDFINSGDTEAELNLRDASGLKTVNIDRITDNSAAANVTEMDATVTAISLNDATRAGTVTFSHKEEVLTGTDEELTFTSNSARAKALNLKEAGDEGADIGFYFETVNVTTTGNNDFDAMTIQANGREDLLLDQPANTTTQDINITANGTVATGSLEINAFTANGAETIDIVANARVEIAKDNEADLDASNDGITTDDLETMTISGAADVMIDGLDTTKDVTLTVNAGTMTGDLSLGIETPSDLVAEDLDLSVTSGSGNDTIVTYGVLAGSITTNDGDDTVAVMDASNDAANMEGVSSISTGEGNDTIVVAEMGAFGDNPVLLRNDGADSAATIDAGNGDNTITVGALASAVKWDDNNTNDANVDDLYTLVGASIVSGDGVDIVNISGAMAENTSISTGAGVDTLNYDLTGLAAVMAGDTNIATEVVSVDDTTTTQDTTTLDLDGAVINLGEGDDFITFTDVDTTESALTLVAAGDLTNNGAGAKIAAGLGNDTLSLVTTDSVTVVTATSAANTAALITGVETINLTILNSVDKATETATGVTQTDTDDMLNTAVTLDVMRVDSDLTAINLASEEKSLMTLTGSEKYESGDDTAFTLLNMRDNVALTLSAYDATAVVGAHNNSVKINAIKDDGAIDINNNNIVAESIDVTLNLDFEVASVDTNADSFAFEIKDGVYGDERDNGTEGYDLSLNLGATSQKAAWTEATSTTDDNDLVIENLTLNFADSKNHLVDLNRFGDAQQSDAPAAGLAGSSVATSLTVTGSVADANIDLFDVSADTVVANIEANVDLSMRGANQFNITTGSGNDNILLLDDNVQSNNYATLTVDEKDVINAGAGVDRIVVNGNDSLGSTGAGTDDDVFENISGVEIVRIQALANGSTNEIVLDEAAQVTGIDTIELTGNYTQNTTITIGENFENDLRIVSAGLELDADNRSTVVADRNESTRITIDSQDTDIDTDVINLDITMDYDNGSELIFTSTGHEDAQVVVSLTTDDGSGTVYGATDNTGAATAGAFGVNATMKIVNNDATAGHNIDVINFLDNLDDPEDDNALDVTVDNAWSDDTLTINAALSDSDDDVTTGGVTIDASMELDADLTIIGSANNDTIIGGAKDDTITGGLGQDTLTGDVIGVVVGGTQEVTTVTFGADATGEVDDFYTMNINGTIFSYYAGDNTISVNGADVSIVATDTVDGIAALFVTQINGALGGIAAGDVLAAYDAIANTMTITGTGVSTANTDGVSGLLLGEELTIAASATNAANVAEVTTVQLANETYTTGDIISIVTNNGTVDVTESYTVKVGDTLASITTALAALINNDTDGNASTMTAAAATPANGLITLTGEVLGTHYAVSSSVSTEVAPVAQVTEFDLTSSTTGNVSVTINGTTYTTTNTGNEGTTAALFVAEHAATILANTATGVFTGVVVTSNVNEIVFTGDTDITAAGVGTAQTFTISGSASTIATQPTTTVVAENAVDNTDPVVTETVKARTAGNADDAQAAAVVETTESVAAIEVTARGEDTFVFAAGDAAIDLTDDASITATMDIITDFVSGQDTISLSGLAVSYAEINADATTANNLADMTDLVAFANANYGTNNVLFIYDADVTNGYLAIDRDGNGATDELIQLQGLNSAADFAATDIA